MAGKKKPVKKENEPVDNSPAEIPGDYPEVETPDNPIDDFNKQFVEVPPVEPAQLTEGEKVLLKVAEALESQAKSLDQLNNNLVAFATNTKSAFGVIDNKVNQIGQAFAAAPSANPGAPGAPQGQPQGGVQQQQGAAPQLSPEQIAKLSPQEKQMYMMQQLQNNPFVGMLVQAMLGQGGMGAKPSIWEEIGKRQMLMSSYMQMQEHKAIASEWAKAGRMNSQALAKTHQMADTLYGDIERMMQQSQQGGQQPQPQQGWPQQR